MMQSLVALGYDESLAARHFDNRFIEYHMEFFRAGITRVLKMWLERGCMESPEDLIKILRSEYHGRL